MAVLAKMRVTSRHENLGSTRPPVHFEEAHGYDCGCEWIPGTQTQVDLTVVIDGDGTENASFAAATPSGSLHLTIDNPEAARYFELASEYYVEVRKARK